MNTQRDKSSDSNAVQIKTFQKGEIRGKNKSFDFYKANTMLILYPLFNANTSVSRISD